MTPWLLAALFAADPPIKGRPDDFIGAVGKFTLSAQIRPTRFRLDEAATLFLKLDGLGDVSQVRTPDLSRSNAFAERFDVVGPSAKKIEQAGVVFEYPVRARSVEVKAVPSVRLSIYDESPPRPQYRLLRTAEIPVDVLTVPARDAAPPPKTEAPGAGPSLGSWTPIVVVVAAAVVAGLLLRRLSQSNARNEGKPVLIPKRRRGKPTELAVVFARSDSERQIDELAEALALPPSKRTSAEISAAAATLGLKEELIETLRRNLESLDASRFGAQATSATLDHELSAIAAEIRKVKASLDGGERSAAPRG